MSGVLLDTCTIRKWYAKQPGVEARVNALPGAWGLYISSVSLGEIEFAHTNPKSLAAEQAKFKKWMRETFDLPELYITGSTAVEYGKLRRACFELFDKKGKYTENREDKLGQKCQIDENDLWLAAQAIERNLTLITIDGMSRIGEVIAVVDVPRRLDVWPDN